MVSIRKRRHLGIQEKYKILHQLSRLNQQNQPPKPKVLVDTHQQCDVPSVQNIIVKKEVLDVKPIAVLYADNANSKPSVKDVEGVPVKNRKPSRRKQTENQDSCMLRGVYFKNMKWQAAIKVEKKQIHLGTVSSMEEAAHLYDRAAYLCGRVPNFELSEEEKRELQGLQWDEFLMMTKEAIANKKKRKRVETHIRKRRTPGLIEDGGKNTMSFNQPISLDQLSSFNPETPQHPTLLSQQTLTLAPFPHHQTQSLSQYHQEASHAAMFSLQDPNFTANPIVLSLNVKYSDAMA